MPTPPRLRDARPADLPALLALEAPFPSDRLSARQFRYHLARGDGRLRVAVAGGELLGYALTLRGGRRLARLYSIAVDASARGRGIGARLLADAEHRARAGGRGLMRLEVQAGNAAAITLYEAAGYRRVRFVAGYYEDGSDAWRYEKAL
ncbi:MAG TPA: GNAT family N-acetyltransferase [Xanthomonadaceae bacterium]|nr:GNAT family N-acetyltransferase [Xanthomonadaceae bacterium]